MIIHSGFDTQLEHDRHALTLDKNKELQSPSMASNSKLTAVATRFVTPMNPSLYIFTSFLYLPPFSLVFK